MLHNAGEPHSSWLHDIANQAITEWTLIRSLNEASLRQDTLALYAASYALIRIGNVVSARSRDLEIIYPNYGWVYWVNFRNSLAHQPSPHDRPDVGDIWVAVSQSLPELVRVITGQPPP